jgi:hypothetical protein
MARRNASTEFRVKAPADLPRVEGRAAQALLDLLEALAAVEVDDARESAA